MTCHLFDTKAIAWIYGLNPFYNMYTEIIGKCIMWGVNRGGKSITSNPLQWRHYGHDCVSNLQPLDCLLSSLYRRRSKKTSKLRVTGLFAGNSPVTGEFPAQMASNAENDVSIWWRHHALFCTPYTNEYVMNYMYLISQSETFFFFNDNFRILSQITDVCSQWSYW